MGRPKLTELSQTERFNRAADIIQRFPPEVIEIISIGGTVEFLYTDLDPDGARGKESKAHAQANYFCLDLRRLTKAVRLCGDVLGAETSANISMMTISRRETPTGYAVTITDTPTRPYLAQVRKALPGSARHE